MITGMTIHILGYATIVAGGAAASSDDSGLSLAITISGAQIAALGACVSTLGFQAAHRRKLREGFSVDDKYKKRSVALNVVSTTLLVGAIGTGVAAISEDSFELALASGGLSLGAGLLAIGNVFGPQKKWNQDLRWAPQKGTSLRLAPSLALQRNHHGDLQPSLGIAGGF